MALLVPCGWIATNLAAVIAELGAIAAFAMVLARRGVRERLWPLIAFAFGAALWVHATQTMDYAFGLAFFLAAYAALLSRQFTWAGVMLALAVGCRPSYGLLLVPAATFLWMRGRLAAVVSFAVGFAPAVLVVEAPVLFAPETRDLAGHLARHAAHHATGSTLIPLLRGSVVFLIGKWAAAAFAIAVPLAAARRMRGSRPAEAPPDRAAFAFEVLAAVAVAGFFLVIPYEPAYLLPVLPLILITAARALPRPWTAVVAIAMALQSLLSFEFADRRLAPGDLFVELAERHALLDRSNSQLAARPTAPTAYTIGRFGIHRLIALGGGLEVGAAGWSSFSASGVALQSSDGRRIYAERFTAAGAESLRNSGWRIRGEAP
ncbi:MAG: hypothetical protein HYR73_03885 [Candidatus Eisenbacteria bacterium]|nr:hypothetical protein [Candidatus Eisenbacteria bacterium]